MQIHTLQPKHKHKHSKRVGRGGKRGTFSGHGSKGQKSRAGAHANPGFRGGNEPIWKLFPKQRGSTKKVDVKHAKFQLRNTKPIIINLDVLNRVFQEGESVTPKKLVKRGLIKTAKHGVKILGSGTLNKKLLFSDDIKFSKSAHDKVRKDF